MRLSGAGPSLLGQRYGVDHSTIIYHCKRNGVVMPRGKQNILASGVITINAEEIQIRRQRIVVRATGPMILTDSHDGSRINPGKNYAEYIEERKKREEAAFWAKVTNKKLES